MVLTTSNANIHPPCVQHLLSLQKCVGKFIPSIFSMTHILVESSWSFWIIKPLKKVKTNCLKSSYRRKKKDLFFIHAQLSEMKKCNGFSGWYLKQGNKYCTTIYEKTIYFIIVTSQTAIWLKIFWSPQKRKFKNFIFITKYSLLFIFTCSLTLVNSQQQLYCLNSLIQKKSKYVTLLWLPILT